MGAMASQITGVSIVYLNVCSGAIQRKLYSFTLLAFVGGIHRWPVNSPHKGPVSRKMLPFDDVIMEDKEKYSMCQCDETHNLDNYTSHLYTCITFQNGCRDLVKSHDTSRVLKINRVRCARNRIHQCFQAVTARSNQYLAQCDLHVIRSNISCHLAISGAIILVPCYPCQVTATHMNIG